MTEVIRIDENTWRIEDSYVRFFLLTGQKKAVLIDSGIESEDAKDIAKTLTNLPIMLINTHGDTDHVSGTGSFDRIYMAKEDYISKNLNERFPNTLLEEIHDGDLFDLGNRTLEIISIPGHTKGSVAILDIEKRCLYSGDTVQSGHIFMFGNHRLPEEYENSLNRLIRESDRFDTIIPSHDEPLLDADYILKVRQSWQEVRSGQVKYQEVNLHGMNVKSYDTKYCGFYCE